VEFSAALGAPFHDRVKFAGKCDGVLHAIMDGQLWLVPV
jgi:hypothetical protein